MAGVLDGVRVVWRGVSCMVRVGWVRVWMWECVCAPGVCEASECVRPAPLPRLHLDLIWSGRDPRPAGQSRNEKQPSCEAPSAGRCAVRPLWAVAVPRFPRSRDRSCGPGAQKWWIDQIDEAGFVPATDYRGDSDLSPTPGHGCPTPVHICGLVCCRSETRGVKAPRADVMLPLADGEMEAFVSAAACPPPPHPV